jgi:hypothetical protein
MVVSQFQKVAPLMRATNRQVHPLRLQCEFAAGDVAVYAKQALLTALERGTGHRG